MDLPFGPSPIEGSGARRAAFLAAWLATPLGSHHDEGFDFLRIVARLAALPDAHHDDLERLQLEDGAETSRLTSGSAQTHCPTCNFGARGSDNDSAPRPAPPAAPPTCTLRRGSPRRARRPPSQPGLAAQRGDVAATAGRGAKDSSFLSSSAPSAAMVALVPRLSA